ncbi:hypothetical protein U1Q18_020869, partial [Sarracenia purpurea var. burkii]
FPFNKFVLDFPSLISKNGILAVQTLRENGGSNRRPDDQWRQQSDGGAFRLRQSERPRILDKVPHINVLLGSILAQHSIHQILQPHLHAYKRVIEEDNDN